MLTIHPIRRPPPTYDVPLCVQMDGCQTVPEMEILNKCCYRKAAGDVAHPLAVREGLRHRAQADQSHKGGREVVDRPAVEPIVSPKEGLSAVANLYLNGSVEQVLHLRFNSHWQRRPSTIQVSPL